MLGWSGLKEILLIRPRSIWSFVLTVSALAILLTLRVMGQTTTQPAVTAPASPHTEEAPKSQREKAEQELKQQEHQRILGVIPNFNTTNLQNAAPLTPGEKFRLAFRSAIDPVEFLVAGLDAGYSQSVGDFPGYGQGAQGYGKRFGAAYADQFSGLFWGNAVFPTLLHEDPRYFRKGSGSIKQRLLYSLSTAVWTKHDNGTTGFNYANALGNITAGGLANIYYPSTDRGVGLTFQRAFTVTAEGMIGAVFIEFWPDISGRLSHRHRNKAPNQPAPGCPE